METKSAEQLHNKVAAGHGEDEEDAPSGNAKKLKSSIKSVSFSEGNASSDPSAAQATQPRLRGPLVESSITAGSVLLSLSRSPNCFWITSEVSLTVALI